VGPVRPAGWETRGRASGGSCGLRHGSYRGKAVGAQAQAPVAKGLRATPVERLHDGLPDAAAIASARLLFVADLPDALARPLAEAARAARVPVNVEDVPDLCDFHVPATVRRGDLLLTVSTGGRAPGAAARIRAELARQFGPEWSARLDAIAAERAALRAVGLPMPQVARQLAMHMEAAGWLPGSPHETAGSTINAF
jgi:siroheme synthase-like protein